MPIAYIYNRIETHIYNIICLLYFIYRNRIKSIIMEVKRAEPICDDGWVKEKKEVIK